MADETLLSHSRQILSHSLYSILSSLKAIRTKVLNGVRWVDTRIRGEENIFIARWRQLISQHYKKLLLSFAVPVGVLVVIGIILIPQRQVAPWRNKLENYKTHPHLEIKEYLKLENDARKLENDARTTLVQAFGGLAILIGLLFTWRNIRATERTSQETLRISQEEQITERFTRAIDQLGSNKLEIRLGGIYALERIARDSERDHWPIMEVLTAYVRENAPWKEESQRSRGKRSQARPQPIPYHQPLPKLPTDIQAVLTVLARRTWFFHQGHLQSLDLSRTNLPRANLRRAQFPRVDLGRARLPGADLGEAELQLSYLGGAQLQGASLWNAELGGANLEGAQLQRAYLSGAQLRGANLKNAQLEGAENLTVEQLSTVKTLYGAQLGPSLLEQIQRYSHLLALESQW